MAWQVAIPAGINLLGGIFGALGEHKRGKRQDRVMQQRFEEFMKFFEKERTGAVRDIAQRTESDIAEAGAASRARAHALGQRSPGAQQAFFAPLRGRAAGAGTRGMIDARHRFSSMGIQAMGSFMGRPIAEGGLNIFDILGGIGQAGAGTYQNVQLLQALRDALGTGGGE